MRNHEHARSAGGRRIPAPCRSRAHLREIDAVYGGTQGGALKAALSERFKGGLRRGVLLLFERSEVYYARKLHAAFHGTKKTKGLERGALPRLKKLVWVHHEDGRTAIPWHGQDSALMVIQARIEAARPSVSFEWFIHGVSRWNPSYFAQED